ncbi:glyoxylase-like metal-dependent hydrolase (beta-lactamase superfamily II) [Halarchaeum rubridurum]|uniref:Flavoprotein n=1 Tax=Halarchaeum rubridurum TaxID=489911 RepID=A0A830G5F4_9EURY|nr:MBL fold metallo-hydrolase [Halarchaeum rubridurum]MBP1955626.1 glyoxylase-like metal-dependent hydrolase (beta-lactamase superfamily II) [Halarchaeum rubridurum]GGM76531.1 flavoprotein [Halarchaeum rubridurum]
MITNCSAGVSAFTCNAYLVTGERTVLVDAGANYDVVSAVREHVADLDAVVLTHTHPDHVENVPALREAFGVETWGFDPEREHVDHAIADGASVTLGDHAYDALHTPGHKDDHLVFLSRAAGVGFVGDLVFAGGSFGRTDLEEGDAGALVESIERLDAALDGAGIGTLHAGHGPEIDDPRDGVAASLRAARFAR